MSILAVVSVAGVVFAFNNSAKQEDVYGNVTTYVDRPDITLEIEVEKDETADHKFKIVETNRSYATFNITVSGLPETADRGVELNQSSLNSGVVTVDKISTDDETQKTGVSTFVVRGRNGGSPVALNFTTRSGGKMVTVNVTVNLVAKYMELGGNVRFGVRQGATGLNFNTADSLSKFVFYAHPDDITRSYKPNKFPVQYRLLQDYEGVTLENGQILVDETATCINQYIMVQAKLPAMDDWLDVPVYVFPAANKIIVDETNAYQAVTTQYNPNIYDLIANRQDFSSANFRFITDGAGIPGVNYGFMVQSMDTSLVRVDNSNNSRCERTLSTVQNLGEIEIKVTAYPIINKEDSITGAEICFNDVTDANVQLSSSIFIRVRNEFYEFPETNAYELRSSKKTLDAFFYEGNQGGYVDTFSLDTNNGKTINYDADIEFELEVVDQNKNNGAPVFYDRTNGLYNILNIGVWTDTEGWVPLSANAYYTNYKNTFSMSFAQTAYAQSFLGPHITSLTLRAKSLYDLSIGGKATCAMKLEATCAIDKLEVTGLTTFDDGVQGVALVYNANKNTFSSGSFNIYGLIKTTTANGDVYNYSQKWDPVHKIRHNNKELPFILTGDTESHSDAQGKFNYLTYEIKANDISKIEYYQNYELKISYTNAIPPITVNIRVFPTVDSMSMNVVSDSNGKIYRTNKSFYGTLAYEYVYTTYVCTGYTYRFFIDTPGVSVGAYAMIYTSYDAKSKVGVGATTLFDARNLKEGLYHRTVRLCAYSDEVYADYDVVVEVNFVVVEPIGNVTLPSTIVLDGVTPPDKFNEFKIEMTSLEGTPITDFTYLCIDRLTQDQDKNLTITNVNINTFRVAAKYLTEEPINLKFQIYKRYNFNCDLSGDNVFDEEDDVFEIYYTGGNLVTTTVVIEQEKPNKIKLVDGFSENNSMGTYLELVSALEPENIPNKAVHFRVAADATYQDYGIHFIGWKNGKFIFNPFDATAPVNAAEIPCLDPEKVSLGNEVVNLAASVDCESMGLYALVIYAKDSLRYVHTVTDENNVEHDYVLPDTYVLLPLYVGSSQKIDEIVEELQAAVHDGNSGARNTRGGFNWVQEADSSRADNSQPAAILFYTPGEDNYSSSIVANKYYISDLYKVLGWPTLRGGNIGVQKISNGEVINKDPIILKPTNGLLWLDLDGIYNTKEGANGENYSHDDVIVYYNLMGAYGTVTFFVVKSIDLFQITIDTLGTSGLVARRNLSPNEYTSEVDTVTIQRGSNVNFKHNLNTGETFWSYVTNFDKLAASDKEYQGGTYYFKPYVKFHDPVLSSNIEHEFTIDALTANVQVNARGGVNYLDIAQESITLDGVSAAVYDVTVRVDENQWSNSILKYTFAYNSVYYDLFVNNADHPDVDYISLEGGKSKLKFSLTHSDPVAISSSIYYLYYLRIEVMVVIESPDVDPFYDISGAKLMLQENLTHFSLNTSNNNASDSAYLNIFKQGIDNITLAHFADTSANKKYSGALTIATGQSDSNVIYLDDSANGILVVYPTPYYINVTNISLQTIRSYSCKVVIGTDLSRKEITDTVKYSVGFMQMIYNETEKIYQPYVSGGSMPKMVSSWSTANGYKWDGRYYFKTYIVSDLQVAHRLPDDTSFDIRVTIQGESNANPVVQDMTLFAKYRNGFIVESDDEVGDYAVCTIRQTQYQAIGTTSTYDISFPSDYTPNYEDFTLYGDGLKYASVGINKKDGTLTVTLNANMAAIGSSIEVRVPYRMLGGYANPYLSVTIYPVCFEFESLEVVGHYESRMQFAALNNDELFDKILPSLPYRGVVRYNTALANRSLLSMIEQFNKDLKSSSAVTINTDFPNELRVEIAYSYVNGVPELNPQGALRYAKTFYYDNVVEVAKTIYRTEYLPVGTAATYDFKDWNYLQVHSLKLVEAESNPSAIADLWDKNLSIKDNTVSVTVSLQNIHTKSLTDEEIDKLIKAKTIVLNIYSSSNLSVPQLQLTIVPVYFTFSGFKLHNYPAKPIVATTIPLEIAIEADGVVRGDSLKAREALENFNETLLAEQADVFGSLSLTSVADKTNILNFDYDAETRLLKCKVDTNTKEPITGTSYLLVEGEVVYTPGTGIPTLTTVGNKQKISTYLMVKTYGQSKVEGNINNQAKIDYAPNNKTSKYAQAIGTKQTYDITASTYVTRQDSEGKNYLENMQVFYNRDLILYEIGKTTTVRKGANDVWDWDVTIKQVKEFDSIKTYLVVDLQDVNLLTTKTLCIVANSQEKGEFSYVVYITPAYYTVDKINLADYQSIPPYITKKDNWLATLNLDFESHYVTSKYNQYKEYMNAFRSSLNDSEWVERYDYSDSELITFTVGIDYEDGLPRLNNALNSSFVVTTSHKFKFASNKPNEYTKAQAINSKAVDYAVDKNIGAICGLREIDGEMKWIPIANFNHPGWDATPTTPTDADKPSRSVTVQLDESKVDDLINEVGVITLGIFETSSIVGDPACILNVIPVYFVVNDIIIQGQSKDDQNVYIVGATPADLKYDWVIDDDFVKTDAITGYVKDFKRETNEQLDYIFRSYNASKKEGKLTVRAYVRYENGKPKLIDYTKINEYLDSAYVLPEFVKEFHYQIFDQASPESDYPYLPTGPRTRTEVQAIGTTKNYVIDLDIDQPLSLDFNATQNQTGWSVEFADNVLSLTLDADNPISFDDDIVLHFYVGFEDVFVLTVQPVLFKVVGFAVENSPEQPIDLNNWHHNTDNFVYRAVAEFNADAEFQGENVEVFLQAFNTQLNNSNLTKVTKTEIDEDDDGTIDHRFVTFMASITYDHRDTQIPSLLSVDSNPVEVVASSFEYVNTATSSSAKHYQAIGTEKYYYLGSCDYENLEFSVSVSDSSYNELVSAGIEIRNYNGIYYQDGSDTLFAGDYALYVNLDANKGLLYQTITIVVTDKSNGKVVTFEIVPVWFVVDGVEVINHPEHHLWLIAPDEKVSTLKYHVKATYTLDGDDDLHKELAAELSKFDQSLATDWAQYLECYTFDCEYLVVNMAVTYENVDTTDSKKHAQVVNINTALPTQVVRSAFKYVRYCNASQMGLGLSYPNTARAKTVAQAVGVTKKYTIDVPNLQNLSVANISIFEIHNAVDVENTSKYIAQNDAAFSDGWEVDVKDGRLEVTLKAESASTLVNYQLKVYVYYGNSGVGITDPTNTEKIAYILTINPVWFTVTGITIKDHPEDTIWIDIDDTDINTVDAFIAAAEYLPILEYSQKVYQEYAILEDLITEINQTFANSDNAKYLLCTKQDISTETVTITDPSTSTSSSSDPSTSTSTSKSITITTSNLQVVTSIAYKEFAGATIAAYFSDDPATRIWNNFNLKVADEERKPESVKQCVQAIGSTKTYFIDNTITGQTYGSKIGDLATDEYEATVYGDYVIVKLSAEAAVDEVKEIALGDSFSLEITPVYYEILGFDVVEHPERPVWIISPTRLTDLKYCAITNDDIPTDLEINVTLTADSNPITNIQDLITIFNLDLNKNSNFTLRDENNKYAILGANISYTDGYPVIVATDNDRRSVVESIFEYKLWSPNLIPNPEKPPVMGNKQVNQLVGTRKSYTLKNIDGQVVYQSLWVENAGKIISPFQKSLKGDTIIYDNVIIKVNTIKNSIQVELTPSDPISNCLEKNIKINIPYLTIQNGQRVWSTYCLEITPVLFELTGWHLENEKLNVGNNPYQLLLASNENSFTAVKFVAEINTCPVNTKEVQEMINTAKRRLENNAANYIVVYSSNDKFVNISNGYLNQYKVDKDKEVAYLTLVSYVEYQYGVATLVNNSSNQISTPMVIGVGYSADDPEWKSLAPSTAKGMHVSQAIGTEYTYDIDLNGAFKIFKDAISVVDAQSLSESELRPVTIEGETKLVEVVFDKDDADLSAGTLTVTLAPVEALLNFTDRVAVRIPYAKNADAVAPTDYYVVYISPVLYTVEGVQLVDSSNNTIDLRAQDIPIALEVKARHSDNTKLKSLIDLNLEQLNQELNTYLRNYKINWTVSNVSGEYGANVSVISSDEKWWLHRMADVDASDDVVAQFKFGYQAGYPVVVFDKTTFANNIHSVFTQIRVNTKAGEEDNFIGWNALLADDKYKGDVIEYYQAIGTSSTYNIRLSETSTQKFDFRHIYTGTYSDYFNLAYGEKNTLKNLQMIITLQANAKYINEIEILIPYAETTDTDDGFTVYAWRYYTIKIYPVLFEINGWTLKINDQVLDKTKTDDGREEKVVEINDSAVELFFTPDIKPINYSVFYTEDVNHIKSAIHNLEQRINEYDPTISDGYKYMIINNTPAENQEVNYTVFRDTDTETSYMLRTVGEKTTTIMALSANISYKLNQVNGYVSSADTVLAYDDKDAHLITDYIKINTTDRKLATATGERTTVFITQDNAGRLASLSANTDYILMSDIYMYQISSNTKNGAWKPVDFPANTTLDGNNHKIFFNNAGFDLGSKPGSVGMFSSIPATSVVKNLQIVLEHGTNAEPITTLEVDLNDYDGGTVNVGMLAGVNNGIITNCAVLSEWQFWLKDLSNVKNPVTGQNFETSLQYNADGYLYDSSYFYLVEEYTIGDENKNETSDESGATEVAASEEESGKYYKVVDVYDRHGYGLKLTKDNDGNITSVGDVEYDEYRNVKRWIKPDRTNVAKYDGHTAMSFTATDDEFYEGHAYGKLFVNVNNENVGVVLGGLVAVNNKMITNSRVLVDVELSGPSAGVIDEISILSASVGGVVGTNSKNATITSTYFSDGNVINDANASRGNTSYLGGFVGNNQGTIQQSYAMGISLDRENSFNGISEVGAVRTIRNSMGGFVHYNSGVITDCLVNMVIYKTGSEGRVGGFAYQNDKGTIANCIENNKIVVTSGVTSNYYDPFLVYNGEDRVSKEGNHNLEGLSNLIYAGNGEESDISGNWDGYLKRLTNSDKQHLYTDINQYEGFSIGKANNGTNINAQNTIWEMTDIGPKLRLANEITVSYRKYSWEGSPYLYALGSEKNPYLIWNKEQFNEYVYNATASAVASDEQENAIYTADHLKNIEKNRQKNHLRLVDNVTLNGIQDTYKIVYTGVFEGNGLTMDGISLNTAANDVAVMGIFGKTEYATIRNISFVVSGGINSTARYTGGISGIAINTNFVDVKITSLNDAVISGVNIVGGVAGLNVVTDPEVQIYNVYSAVSVRATFHSEQTDAGAMFTSGKEYYQQTLYSKVLFKDIYSEQAYNTAGGVFGFITSNPNNYKTVDSSGKNQLIKAREYSTKIKISDPSGTDIETSGDLSEPNAEKSWFLKNKNGTIIDDTVTSGSGLYNTQQIILQNISGDVKTVSGNVAGGLIGIMDETITLQNSSINSLSGLRGKYYLGGLVGINLGKITQCNVNIGDKFNISSSAGNSYIYRKNVSTSKPEYYWGMTVGGVVGYNDGFADNENSGLIENVTVNANVLSNASKALVVGGIVGANGSYGYIDESTVKNTNTKLGEGQVDKELVKSMGFRYGHIIGFSNIGTGLTASDSQIITMEISVNATGSHFVSSENPKATNYHAFDTPNFFITISDGTTTTTQKVNFWGIEPDVTFKKQTMTIREYREYLLNTISRDDLVTRFEKLEVWLRTLHKEVYTETINNTEVHIAHYRTEDQEEFLDWINGNNSKNIKVFSAESGLNAEVAKYAYANYQDYLTYYAISTQPVAISDTDGGEFTEQFDAKIEDYHQQRYEMGRELFTYQSHITANNASHRDPTIQQISSIDNAKFTWQQYQDYLALVAAVADISNWQTTNESQTESSSTGTGETSAAEEEEKDEETTNVTTVASLSSYIAGKYNNQIAEWLVNLSADAEYKYDENDKTKKMVTISNPDDLISLLDGYQSELQFTNRDPLQVYIDYIVKHDNVDDKTITFSDGSKLKLEQYYYYMVHMFGQTYKVKDNDIEYIYGPDKYSIADYTSYMYVNTTLNGKQYTFAEYIDLKERFMSVIIANEKIWLQTGHLSADDSRISAIGGVELGWFNEITSTENEIKDWINNKRYESSDYLTAESGVFAYQQELPSGVDTSKAIWNTYNEFSTAQGKNMSITDYGTIISLGGSLYGLNYGDFKTAKDYIFYLQTIQYQWTDEQQSTFIQNNYANAGGESYDLEYALTATVYGDFLTNYPEYGISSIRAVYESATQVLNEADWNWFADKDSDGEPSSDESFGVAVIPCADSTNGVNFTNGDGKTYKYYRDLILFENDAEGTAYYIDVDGNGLFGNAKKTDNGATSSHSADKDILLLYDVTDLINVDTDLWDFTREDETDKRTHYYRICRKILENGVNITTVVGTTGTDQSGNMSDFLEEALWWRTPRNEQKFTARDFEAIKIKINSSLPENTWVNQSDSNNSVDYTTRGVGFTIADDWYSFGDNANTTNNDQGEFGFVMIDVPANKFTCEEYAYLVRCNNWVEDLTNNTNVWYSIYADYLLFAGVYHASESISSEIVTKAAIQAELAAGSEFRYPTQFNKSGEAEKFAQDLAKDDLLRDAMEFASDKEAFYKFMNSGKRIADYVDWAKKKDENISNLAPIWVADAEGNYEKQDKYFRLNHYIYLAVSDLLDDDWNFAKNIEPDDLVWVLTPEIRSDIFYTGVTELRRTDDLLVYRRDWFNKGGTPFITYRDYCEWINIYVANQDKEGDGGYADAFGNGTGEQDSSSGWLNLDVFAVWKRMEKYENNVEYREKQRTGKIARQDAVTAPILKRQISTTILPRQASSGNVNDDNIISLPDVQATTLIETSKDYIMAEKTVLNCSTKTGSYAFTNAANEETTYDGAWIYSYSGTSEKVKLSQVVDEDFQPNNGKIIYLYQELRNPNGPGIKKIGTVDIGGKTHRAIVTDDGLEIFPEDYTDNADKINVQLPGYQNTQYYWYGWPAAEGEDVTNSFVINTSEKGEIWHSDVNTRYTYSIPYMYTLDDGYYMNPLRQRPFVDRYEYNERYEVVKNMGTERGIIDYWYVNENNLKVKEFLKGDQIFKDLIPINKYSKDCNDACGGKVTNDSNVIVYSPDKCTDPTHAAYQLCRWLDRYEPIHEHIDGTTTLRSDLYYLQLDEIAFRNRIKDGAKTVLTAKKAHPTEQYAQLYIPYDYLEAACTKLKSTFSKDNDYQGYFNFMHFWAKNGDPSWICLYEFNEYQGKIESDVHIVTATYNSVTFWDNFEKDGFPSIFAADDTSVDWAAEQEKIRKNW